MLGGLFVNLGLVSDFLDKVEVDLLFFVVGVFFKVLPPRIRFFDLDWDHSF